MTWESSVWEFETERLRVVGWRRRGDDALAAFLLAALTEPVTRELPPSWQAGVSRDTVADWIAERDAEGNLFAIEPREGGAPVGLFMYFASEATGTFGEVRLGYVLAEPAWGRGYASEVVQGFVRRWDDKRITAALLAGVTADNRASRRVLEKAGFEKVAERDGLLEYRRDHRN